MFDFNKLSAFLVFLVQFSVKTYTQNAIFFTKPKCYSLPKLVKNDYLPNTTNVTNGCWYLMDCVFHDRACAFIGIMKHLSQNWLNAQRQVK